jgi:hypothetical protein
MPRFLRFTEQVGKCRVGQLVISAVPAPHPVQMTNPGPSVESAPLAGRVLLLSAKSRSDKKRPRRSGAKLIRLGYSAE